MSDEQSEFTTHSGRQLGGEPIISGRQEHWQRSPITRGGLLFGPQGFGSHGSTYSSITAKQKNIYELCPTYQYVELTFWRWEPACAERIPNVISQTDTVGNVVDHLALGIDATVSLRTGVLTVQVYAGKPGRAFCVGCALWPARHVGIPKVIRDTLASRSTSPSVADSIAATWRGVAGIHRLWDSWWS